MNRFNYLEVKNILINPLGKKIDQLVVEKWSASFWQLIEKNQLCPKLRDGARLVEQKEPFVMMLPPPNITGNLHLGHALTFALQDALIRQRRMLGYKSIWIPGFDHAGLSTQQIVENFIRIKYKQDRHEFGRENFLKLAHEWKDTKRKEMKNQIDRLGLSLNYEQEYFTLDDKSSHAVQAAFKQLFENDLIYRSLRPVYWSEKMQSTLSDIEVEKCANGTARYTRTGEIVERKHLNQWFVSARGLAERAVEVVEKKYINMIPPNYIRTYSSWLLENGVTDWCISRQNWWGHRIPAYKLKSSEDKKENWIIANDMREAQDKLGSDDIVQDPDILDTWFSSSLLPLTISGWPNEKKFSESQELGLFPLTILETGFDILTFWVSKMVMTSLALTDQIPFKLILLHGMICDSKGKKMSKSKGNVIDPLDVIDGASLENLQDRTRFSHDQGIIEDSQLNFVLENQKKLFPKGIPACGADGLRAYLLSHDIQEEIVRVQILQIEKVRRLSNKIWNIFRFVLPIVENLVKDKTTDIKLEFGLKDLDRENLDESDKILLEKLADCVTSAHKTFLEDYLLYLTFNRLEKFWTIDLSSNYIGGNKVALLNRDLDKKSHDFKLQLMLMSLVTSTKLLHPFMPHLTELLYQKLNITMNPAMADELENLPTLGEQCYPKLDEWKDFLANTR